MTLATITRPVHKISPERTYGYTHSQLWIFHCVLRVNELATRPTQSREEVHVLHSSGRNLLVYLQRQMQSHETSTDSSPEWLRCQADLIRTYCFSAALVLLLGAIETYHQSSYAAPCKQQSGVVDSLLTVARRAQVYKPLGSLSATWALAFAWASTRTASARKEIEIFIFDNDVASFNIRTRTMMEQADALFTRFLSDKSLDADQGDKGTD